VWRRVGEHGSGEGQQGGATGTPELGAVASARESLVAGTPEHGGVGAVKILGEGRDGERTDWEGDGIMGDAAA